MGKQKIGLHSGAEAYIERRVSAVEKVFMKSSWEWEHWRDGELLDRWVESNICCDEGLNHLLGSTFSGVTQVTDWYVLIYNTNTTPTSSMTYAVPVFTESTNYSGATRPVWQDGGVSSQSVDNSANKASFTMNTGETIYGSALVGGGTGATTKGDVAGGGALYNISDFAGGSKTVASDDVLKVSVTLTAADV